MYSLLSLIRYYPLESSMTTVSVINDLFKFPNIGLVVGLRGSLGGAETRWWPTEGRETHDRQSRSHHSILLRQNRRNQCVQRSLVTWSHSLFCPYGPGLFCPLKPIPEVCSSSVCWCASCELGKCLSHVTRLPRDPVRYRECRSSHDVTWDIDLPLTLRSR